MNRRGDMAMAIECLSLSGPNAVRPGQTCARTEASGGRRPGPLGVIVRPDRTIPASMKRARMVRSSRTMTRGAQATAARVSRPMTRAANVTAAVVSLTMTGEGRAS